MDFTPAAADRREVDVMIKAILLAAGGEVKISELDLARARDGYDLFVETTAEDVLIVRARER